MENAEIEWVIPHPASSNEESAGKSAFDESILKN